MPPGRRTRRTAPRVLLAPLMLMALAGCAGLAVPRGSSGPATVSPTLAPPNHSSDPLAVYRETNPAVSPVSNPHTQHDEVPPPLPPEPTPMLDAALVKAKGVREVVMGELTAPESQAEPPAATPVEVAEPPAVVDPPKPKPESEKAPTPPPPPPPGPAEVWKESLEKLRTLARQKPGELPSGVWATRETLLDWLARAEGDSEADRLGRNLLMAVQAVAHSDTNDPGARSDRVREAVQILEDQAPLEITEIQLCREVTTFGVFEPLAPGDLKAGQSVILYWEMAGLRHEPIEDRFRTRLASLVEVVPQTGGEPVLRQNLGTTEDRCRRRRRDYYMNSRLKLPTSLAPGNYELRLSETDVVSGRSAARTLVFTIKP